MPKFSEMFAKRLSENGYVEIKDYLDGKKNFNQVGSEAQGVLKGLTKPEIDRSFDEQEKLYEMKTKLITDKYVGSEDAWDHFEIVYRTFMLGTAARQKFFNLKGTLLKKFGVSPGGITTKSASVDPLYNYNVQKWDKKAMEHFAQDQKTAEFAETYGGMTLEESKIRYKKDFFSFLEDPNTMLIMAEEYRKDFGIKPKSVELQALPRAKTSKITPYKGSEAKEPLLRDELELKYDEHEAQPLLRPSREAFDVPSDFNTTLNKFMTERVDALSFGVTGLRVDSSKFSKWLEEQGEGGVEGIALNLALGVGIQKTLDFVAKASHMSPHGERVMDFLVTESLAGLQMTLASSAVGVAIGAGVLLAQPVIKLVNFLKSGNSERRKANDTPESVYGTQFARVRSQDENGKVTWYPGILASKDLWTGIGSKEQNIRINYGKLEDLRWRFNRDGTFSPFFKNPRYRMINAKDQDLKGYASETQRLKWDPLRDFSLFTLDETDAMFSNLVQGKDLSDFKEKLDDRSKLPKYLQELISYRDDFEWIRQFNTGDENIGRHLDPADRSIRREFQHSVLVDPRYAEGSGIYFDMMNDKKYQQGFTKYKGKLHENKALLSYFDDRMKDLLRSQKIAAEETPDFLKSLKGIGKFDDTYNYTLYQLDTGSPPAKSLDELKQQIQKTDARDLEWYEKNYLDQKNIVRYFANKLSNRALGGDIVHAVTYPHQKTYRLDPKNEQTALNYHGLLNANGSFRLKQVGHTSVLGNPPGPWSNSDEKTIPTWLYADKFMGETHRSDQKEDYIQASEELHKLMEDQFMRPALKNKKFKPGQAFLDSNPFLKDDQGTHTKFRGVIGKDKHQYDRKGERLFQETAEEKKTRLKSEKGALPKAPHHIIPAEVPTSGDPTKRNDPFYRENKNFTWSFLKKRFIPKTKPKPPGVKSVSFEQKFGKTPDTFGGHGTVGLHPKKTKLEKLGDDKGKDSRKKELEHQRYIDRFKKSSDIGYETYKKRQEEKKSHQLIHGMTPVQWKLYQDSLKKKTTPVPSVRVGNEARTVIPKVAPPKPVVQTQQPVNLSALQEYLRDQHGMNVSKSSINRNTLPFLAFDSKGRPALYGDPILHAKMGLPDAYRVVTGPTGVIHKSYDPSKVQPKFFNSHDTGVVERY